jgi:hypothetical protein
VAQAPARPVENGIPTGALVVQVTRIGALRAIEADIRGYSGDDRHRLRLLRSKPLVDASRSWFETFALGRRFHLFAGSDGGAEH